MNESPLNSLGITNKELVELAGQLNMSPEEAMTYLSNPENVNKELAAFEEPKQNPQALESPDSQEYWNDVVRQVLQGTTFGFGDEAIAGVRSVFTDESYDEALDYERKKNEDFQRENTGVAIASQIAGSIPTALIPGAALVRGLNAIRGVKGLSTAEKLKKGLTTGALLKEGAIHGGATGTVHGFGTGETLHGRLMSSGAGAATGIAGGAAGNYATARAGQALHGIIDFIRGTRHNPTAAMLAKKTSEADIDLDTLQQTVKSSDHKTSPSMLDLVYDASKSNPGSNPGHISNELEKAATVGGPKVAKAFARFAPRQEGHQQRLADAFSEAGGSHGTSGAVQRVMKMEDNLASHAGPLYKQLSQMPKVTLEKVDDSMLAAQKEAKKMLQKGDLDADTEDFLHGLIDLDETAIGKLTSGINKLRDTIPEFRTAEREARKLLSLDDPTMLSQRDSFSFDLVNEIQRNLREKAVAAGRGSVNEVAKSKYYTRARKDFNNLMEDHFPGYANVRNKYAQGKEAIEAARAAEKGILARSPSSEEDFFKMINRLKSKDKDYQKKMTSMEGDPFAAQKIMPESEQFKALQELATSRLRDKAFSKDEMHNAAQALNTKNVQHKIKSIFPHSTSRKLINTINDESNQIKRINEVTRGSPSARRIAGLAKDAQEETVKSPTIRNYIEKAIAGTRGLIKQGKYDAVADAFTMMGQRDLTLLIHAAKKEKGKQDFANNLIGKIALWTSQGLPKPVIKRLAEEYSLGLDESE